MTEPHHEKPLVIPVLQDGDQLAFGPVANLLYTDSVRALVNYGDVPVVGEINRGVYDGCYLIGMAATEDGFTIEDLKGGMVVDRVAFALYLANGFRVLMGENPRPDFLIGLIHIMSGGGMSVSEIGERLEAFTRENLE